MSCARYLRVWHWRLTLLTHRVMLSGMIRSFRDQQTENIFRRDRKSQCSIRVNDQWRICFVWSEGDAYDVEVADYH